MCRAVITIVLGAVMIGASLNALAHKIESSLSANSAIVRGAPAGANCLPAGTACRSTALLSPAKPPIPGQMDAVSYRGSDRMNPIPAQHPEIIRSTSTSFSWRSITALLSTLALIGTIALRRSRSGKT